MSWKDYQSTLGRKAQRKERCKRFFVGILCFMAVIGMYQWISAIELPRTQKITEMPAMDKSKLPAEAVTVGVDQVKMVQDGVDLTYDLSIDIDLQKFINQKLQKYRIDWAGVAVMQPDTGRVLALSSYSAKDPSRDMLSLQASFPAASIFKVVTAGALLEETTKSSNSVFQYAGDMRKIHKRYLRSNYRGTSMSLSKAFAKSANGIFGIIGSKYLNQDLLETYAQRFGFNEKIPFEIPVGQSHLTPPLPEKVSDLEVAKLAAGFGKVTLSPLHGAMIASSIVMDGAMMKPTLIDKISDKQDTLYQMQPEVWKTPYSVQNAKDMRAMMKKTITHGTARKAFNRTRHHHIMKRLEIGGKTGSLYGKNPRGRNEWFVSYAVDQKTGQKLAVGVVIVNEKYWKIKPAQLTQWIFQEYFKNVKQPNVVASTDQYDRKFGS